MSTSATPTEEQINRCNYYSDLYKEIYNIRPGGFLLRSTRSKIGIV